MPSVEFLLVVNRMINYYHLGYEIHKSFRVCQSKDIVILIVSLNSENEIHLKVKIGLLESHEFVGNFPLRDVAFE